VIIIWLFIWVLSWDTSCYIQVWEEPFCF